MPFAAAAVPRPQPSCSPGDWPLREVPFAATTVLRLTIELCPSAPAPRWLHPGYVDAQNRPRAPPGRPGSGTISELTAGRLCSIHRRRFCALQSTASDVQGARPRASRSKLNIL